jgi:hemolysin III
MTMSMAPTASIQPVKPRLRGVSHQIAFAVVALAGPILVLTAPGSTRWAAGVYAVCLAGLFGVSAAFHRITWTPGARRRMRRLDHSMIFVFIAGTYTPVAGLMLDDPLATVIVTVVWIGALGGVAIKLLWIDAPRWLSAGSYVLLGWVAVIALPALYTALGAVGFALLVAGGLLYTVGAICYARRSPDPIPEVFGYHEVFHAFVIAAALCHFVVIAGWALPSAA